MSWATRCTAMCRARASIGAMAFRRTLCSSGTHLSAKEASAPAPAASEPDIPLPTPTGQDRAESDYPPKIVSLVDQIERLNLLEVADLNSLLKSRLKITDAPVMMAGAVPAGGSAPGAAAQEEEEDEAAPAVTVQTSFTVKLNGFDAAKKVALIKELKSQVEDMNLVQAKKFVESAPAVVKADIGKDEAEALKKALEAAGAEVAIE